MLPQPDTLMRQLIEIANSENPPCSNCDKRDRANMYYCNTCGNKHSKFRFKILIKLYSIFNFDFRSILMLSLPR